MKKRTIFGMAVAASLLTFGMGNTAKAANVTEAREFNGHYYQVVTTTPADYERAEMQCEIKGAHLATITSKEEQDFIYSLTGKDNVLLGGEYKNGVWTWVTGEPFTYTNWGKNRPSNLNGEKCLCFYREKGEWTNTYDGKKSYVMEWESKAAYKSQKPNVLNKVTYKGHSYKYYHNYNNQVTWTEARDLCEQLGGYLVTITSEGENDFVYSICKPGRHTWIGLSDTKKKGKYKWVTGERTDYRKFSKYVDHGSGGQERYMGFWEYPTCQKKWNDFKNNHPNMAFVCEWDNKNPVILTKPVSTIKVKRGKKVSLKYQVYPVKTKVTFKSSKKRVATVTKKGVVKGVRKGTAHITIKAGKKKVVVKVKVK